MTEHNDIATEVADLRNQVAQLEQYRRDARMISDTAMEYLARAQKAEKLVLDLQAQVAELTKRCDNYEADRIPFAEAYAKPIEKRAQKAEDTIIELRVIHNNDMAALRDRLSKTILKMNAATRAQLEDLKAFEFFDSGPTTNHCFCAELSGKCPLHDKDKQK